MERARTSHKIHRSFSTREIMEVNLLLKLLIAHLLTDFIFQSGKWVEDKKQNKIRSRKLLLHVSITTLVAYVLSGYYSNWIIPLVIFISHYTIDLVKSYLKDSFRSFIIDQLAHILVIVILWLTIEDQWKSLHPIANILSENHNFWLIIAGYTFATWPLGIIIGKGTQKWRNQIAIEHLKNLQTTPLTEVNEDDKENPKPVAINTVILSQEEQGLGLASAGKWIGICERVLILTFVLMQQYTAIGFLMTAKSILRFSEKEANTQLKTEYVLVGTLVSFASSAMLGVLLRLALQ